MINISAQSSSNHPAAFRLASNLKTVWLGRGITPAGIVFRVTEEHKPLHHDKVATKGEFFFGVFYYYNNFFKCFFF